MKIQAIFKPILLIATIILLENCAAPRLPSEPLQFKPEIADHGLIIGSITFPEEKAYFNGYFLNVSTTDQENQKKKEIHFKPHQIIKMKHSGDTDNGRTYLFIMKKPEGKYEIPTFRLFTNLGMTTYDTNIGGFSIPFDVKKGEITYIGNINFNDTMINNRRLNGKIEECIYIKNNFEKDIKSFQNKIPSTNWRLAKDKKVYTINYISLE